MAEEDMDDDKYLEIINEAEENKKWINENYNDLAEKYSNEYICVDNKKVISHSPDIENINKEMGKRPEIVCEYINPPGTAMLL